MRVLAWMRNRDPCAVGLSSAVVRAGLIHCARTAARMMNMQPDETDDRAITESEQEAATTRALDAETPTANPTAASIASSSGKHQVESATSCDRSVSAAPRRAAPHASPSSHHSGAFTAIGNPAAEQLHLQQQPTQKRAGAGSDSDSDEFHDSETDVSFAVVKKSIYKDAQQKSKSGFLHRLKEASSSALSSSRYKFVPTADETSTITPQLPVHHHHHHHRLSREDSPIVITTPAEQDDVSSDAERAETQLQMKMRAERLAEANEDGITVAIESSAPVRDGEGGDDGAVAADDTVDADMDVDFCVAPQVVIHSGESDSDSTGFATLNPVINGGGSTSSRKYRTTTIPLATSKMGSLCTSTSAFPSSTTNMKPVLQEIPVASEENEHGNPFLLIINALGASGLVKVEKFGTQSTFLEMKVVCPSAGDSQDIAVGTKPLTTLSSVMRTVLHKKGGSEAQWNQQFTTSLGSKDTQVLHVSVKTNNKIVVGEAQIPLTKVGDLFYDQHYTLYRSGADTTTSEDIVSGHVHLQLKIVDAASIVVPSVVVPPLQLPFPPSNPSSSSSNLQSRQRGEYHQAAATIPSVLSHGALLYKVPYHNRGIGAATPRRQWVMVTQGALSESSLEITWCDPTASSSDKKSMRSLDLRLVTEVREGHRTKAFERQVQTASSSSVVHGKEKCFSLVSKARSLDLVASCKEEAQVWVCALRELLFQSLEAGYSDSARIIEDFKSSALSPRSSLCPPQKDTPFSFTSTATTNNKNKPLAWRNAIFDLARKNRIQEISEYLHDGCPIDLLEPGDGDTILMIACRLGHVPLVELCLSWRAKNDPHPEFGETALQVAVNSSHAKCVELLLSTAAESDMDSEIVNHIDSNNDAPLHVAARHGDLACLQLLLHHGADICVVEEFGRTPLHCAVAQGHLDCVAYLLDVGGDSVLNAGDHDGDTALHYAALAGNESIVKLLLESAANVFSANIQNETPYDLALREKQQQCTFLISQYYLTNTKEPPMSSPATRNETASALLLRRKQLEDDGDEDDESDSDASTAYASHSPQRGLSYNERASHDDFDSEFLGSSPSASTYGSSSESHFALPSPRMLSPSDLVREALLRNHPQRQWREAPAIPTRRYERYDDHHNRGHCRPSHGSFYYSAREVTPSHPPFASSSSNSRTAFTERIDRDHYSHPSSFQYLGAHEVHPYPETTAYSSRSFHHHQQQQQQYHTSGRNRSHSDQMHYESTPTHEGEWMRYEESVHPQEYHQARRSNSMDMSISRGHRVPFSVRNGWESSSDANYEPISTPSKHSQEQQQQQSSSTNPLWDTFYTEDGYPYYVHRITGASQWEPPPSAPPSLPSHQSNRVGIHDTKDTMSPDSIIRMRLAEARRQKSTTHLNALPVAAPTSSSAIASAIPTSVEPQLPSQTGTLTRDGEAESIASRDAAEPRPALRSSPHRVPIPDKDPSEKLLSQNKNIGDEAEMAPSARSPSKFEARTGLKLSVDISSPTRQDGKQCLHPCFSLSISPASLIGCCCV